MVKKLIFLGVCVAIFVSVHYHAILGMDASTTQAGFTDMDERYRWAEEAVTFLSQEGIINGMEEGKFAPGLTVKREQFAKMVALAFDLELPGTPSQTFVDVPSDKWSFPYIEATKDLIPREAGLPVNQYNPSAECTREQVAAAIVQALGFAETDVGDVRVLERMFTDEAEVSPELRTCVAIAVEKNILQGDAGTLRAKASVTRAEAAVFLQRGMTVKDGGTVATPAPATQTPIVGEPQVTLAQAKKWAEGRGADQRYIDIADLYWQYGELTGIRPEVLYAQAAKETNFGKYTGNVQPEQNNWAGIKTDHATGDKPEDHESFATPEDGVRAHFNHMAAYVGIEPVGQPHARYEIVKSISWAGTVQFVEELGGKWAPEPTYGVDMLTNYIQPMMETEA